MHAAPLALAALLCVGCASPTIVQQANAAAVADASTTLGGLAVGGAEANPLLGSTTAAVAGVLVLKLGLVQATAGLDPEDRKTTLRFVTSLWSGAAFNNLVVIAGGATPVGWIAGIGAAVVAWRWSDQ